MRIDLRECEPDEGAYGLVVFVENKTKAVKIFFRSHEEKQASNVYESEVEAYRLASINKEASSLIPVFYGEVRVEEVIDIDGCDVSDQYFLNMAYIMSFEAGPYFKFNTISSTEQARLKMLFEPLGIHYLVDSSVSLSKDGTAIKIIDFATREFELWA